MAAELGFAWCGVRAVSQLGCECLCGECCGLVRGCRSRCSGAMSWRAKACHLLAAVTVEPVLLLYMIGSTMQYTAVKSLTYDKVCRGLYSSSVCDSLTLSEHKAELDAVQDSASYWTLYSNVALAVPSIVSGVYIGTWSDLFSRKVPLLLPPLGQLLSAVVYMCMSTFPSLSVGYIVLANLLEGCFGGFTSMIMAGMSYLAAVTLPGQRTSRVSVLESMWFLGGFLGPFVGSLLFRYAGRTWTFTALAACSAAILLYVVTLVREVPPPRPPAAARSACHALTRLFSLRHLWDAVMTAAKPRPDHRRCYILALLICTLVIMVNSSGVIDVTYLYVKDVPLCVQDRTYFGYFAFTFACWTVALLVLLPLLRHRFQLSDTGLCGIGLTSKILGLVWLGFSVNEGMLFVVPLVSMMSAFCIPPIRSLLSKLVEANEQGRMFSLVMAVDNLCTLLGSALYNSVYPATRRWLHGLVFCIGAATLLVPVGLLLTVHRRLRAAGHLHRLPPATAAAGEAQPPHHPADGQNGTAADGGAGGGDGRGGSTEGPPSGGEQLIKAVVPDDQ